MVWVCVYKIPWRMGLLKLKRTEAEVFLSVTCSLTVGWRSCGVQFFSHSFFFFLFLGFFWSRRGREPRRQTTFVRYFGCLKDTCPPLVSHLANILSFSPLRLCFYDFAERKMKRKYFPANLHFYFSLSFFLHEKKDQTFQEKTITIFFYCKKKYICIVKGMKKNLSNFFFLSPFWSGVKKLSH